MNDYRKNIFNEAVACLMSGRWDSLEELIGLHPDVVNQYDERGRNLLLIASQIPGSMMALKKLIAWRADVNVVSACGDTVATGLIDTANPIGLDNLEELAFVLKSGFQPNVIGLSGFPPLHWAIYHNRLKHAGLLLKYGADPYMKTNDFYPEDAFEVARAEGNYEALELLKGYQKT